MESAAAITQIKLSSNPALSIVRILHPALSISRVHGADLLRYVPVCLRRIDAAAVLQDRAIYACDGIFDEAVRDRMFGRVVGGAPGSRRRNRLGQDVGLRSDKRLLDGRDCRSRRHLVSAAELGECRKGQMMLGVINIEVISIRALKLSVELQSLPDPH